MMQTPFDLLDRLRADLSRRCLNFTGDDEDALCEVRDFLDATDELRAAYDELLQLAARAGADTFLAADRLDRFDRQRGRMLKALQAAV